MLNESASHSSMDKRVLLDQLDASGGEHHGVTSSSSGWMSDDLWRERVQGIRARHAKDDEDALLNATLRL